MANIYFFGLVICTPTHLILWETCGWLASMIVQIDVQSREIVDMAIVRFFINRLILGLMD